MNTDLIPFQANESNDIADAKFVVVKTSYPLARSRRRAQCQVRRHGLQAFLRGGWRRMTAPQAAVLTAAIAAVPALVTLAVTAWTANDKPDEELVKEVVMLLRTILEQGVLRGPAT